MALPIADYGLIGDLGTAALVGRDGSIDWWCVPRFDSAACFAALLGQPEHGRWLIAPAAGGHAASRRYRGDSLILEQDFETASGRVRVIDFMPLGRRRPDLVRIVEGLDGVVDMTMELVVRTDYGSVVPSVSQRNGEVRAIAGPDALTLHASLAIDSAAGASTETTFTIRARQRQQFVLTWHHSYERPPSRIDPDAALASTQRWWQQWADRCSYEGPWRDTVLRSLITLKALTFARSGGIVAAPTTSLPEQLGGVRNWDYRYCWLRDATFTLYALMVGGYTDEADAWRTWLLRAVAGEAADLQIMYGCTGERRLTEYELPWLPGYDGAHPVRVGNLAVHQRQLDVFGEVMDALHVARRSGLGPEQTMWDLQRGLLDYLERIWQEPDEGIWEMRGPRRQFTHSKVMAWVAFDRAVQDAECRGLDGPVARWRQLRDRIHRDVCANGFDRRRGTFTQFYGSHEVDASLLMIPLVGFLPPDDPQARGTVDAVARDLMHHGFVRRYPMHPGSERVDGLPPGEGCFLACTCWLADNFALQGRLDDAEALFERVLDLRNDLGLLSEQYDPEQRRLAGNFPQAFSHVALINTARNLARHNGPAEHRRRGAPN